MAAILTSLLIALSLAGLIMTAAARQPGAYAGLAGLSCIGILGLALWSQYRLEASGAGRASLAASAARHIAYVWVFGALTLLSVYGFILSWREWLAFGLGMLAAGGLCYGLSVMFEKDALSGRSDPAMLGLARTLGLAQVIGMVIVMVGLYVDGKMTVALAGSRSDWAANSTFFSGALAIALIGAWSLIADKRAARRDAARGAA